MSLIDSRGVPFSTRSAASLAHYEKALQQSVTYTVDPLATIQGALEADPSFASGHCLRAALMVTATDRTALPMLAESVEAIEALGRRANDRERAHGAAARLWLEGDFAGSVRAYGDILLDHPRDLLALQVAHIGDFFLGASNMLRDRIAQVVPEWEPTTPGYGYVLGMYAFGLEETALYSRAEDVGRRALEIDARDAWAVHAVTHVMEMQGRARDGIEWLTGREQDWAVDNGFAFHNWWHLALFNLDIDDTARALEIYDRKIRATSSQIPLEMIDGSGMLWRLTLRGVDVQSRWQDLAKCWEPSVEHAYYAFNDVHAAMAFVGAQRVDLVQRLIEVLERRAAGTDTNAMMTRDVGLPLVRGLAAFGAGRYDDTIERLLPVRGIANRFGGSHAQRDLIHLTLVEAALRGGKAKLARSLAAERTQLKPTSPFNWRLTERALELNGDHAAAAKARENSATRRKAQFASHRAVA